MNINTTDKVQVGNSTTGTGTNTSTSTTWHCPYIQPKAEQGWECPRCGRINAPWVRQCDCTRETHDYDKWTTTPTWTDSEWWKTYITCSKADANTYISKDKTEVGGSDYWDSNTHTWVNVAKSQTNTLK